MSDSAYKTGSYHLLAKLGLAQDLDKQLRAAIKDETQGHEEYLALADTAHTRDQHEIEAMAREHAKDEMRHFHENSDALEEYS